MMWRHLIIGTAVAFALLSSAGCSHGYSEPFAQPDRRRPSLDNQLHDAKAIQNPRDRDDAIALVAKQAANVGDVHWAKQAVSAISNWEARDDAALAVAVRLSKGGKDEAAREMAGTIASSIVREETLKYIANAK